MSLFSSPTHAEVRAEDEAKANVAIVARAITGASDYRAALSIYNMAWKAARYRFEQDALIKAIFNRPDHPSRRA